MRQFPRAFEPHERLLSAIAEHAYSGRFGTFLYDNDADRQAASVMENTESLWSYVLSPMHRDKFISTRYEQLNGSRWQGPGNHLLLPETRVAALTIWPHWRCKWLLLPVADQEYLTDEVVY